jgi:hypothetical protein
MKRVIICMAVAGFLLAPALAWAKGPCCGENNENVAVSPSTEPAGTYETDVSNSSGPCNTCNKCKPKCGFCDWLSGRCNHCNTCGSHMTKTKVQYWTEKTSYKLVKTCEPVCHEKTVHHSDPCNPCIKTCSIVSECHNRTRYHWVCETKPVCHTKTVKVCSTCAPVAAPCCGTPVTETAFGGTQDTISSLSETIHNQNE